MTLPAAATAPTAVKLDDAAVGRRRPANVAVTFKTSAPANAVTWTDPVDVDVQHQLRPLTAPPGPADRARRATARR